MYAGYSNILIDDIELDGNYNIQGGKIHLLWNSGYSENTKLIRMYFFEETGDCDPSMDEYPEAEFYIEANTFTEETTGQYYFGRPEVVVDFLLDEEISLYAGNWWIGIQPEGTIDNIAYLLTAEGSGCEVHADLPYWGYPRWSTASYLWGSPYDLAFEVHGRPATGPPAVKAWIQPGTEDIESVVMNYGTFDYEDLTCYAQVREYITDPENGTEILNETIGNIDLTPLGGSDNLDFGSTIFADEGRYGLYMQLPADPDDVSKNNQVSWGVAVDDTNPFSDYPPIFDPENPTGENDWYVDDVTVTLNATDPWSHGVSSGVKEIRYTVNGGAEQVIPGKTGSFVLTEDGEDIQVEYWAVDWVGNAETPKNSFTINIDQTIPEIALTYEIVGGNPYQGWDFEFKATATDAMSGMERVEFYFNNELQETVSGSGPEYIWTLRYWPIPKAIFRATGYDMAGLFNSDEIIDPTTQAHSTPQSHESQEQPRQQPLPR
jgi:hypothetical protein